MDWNPKTALEWDWENLAGISAKAIDNPKLMKPANRVIERDGGVDNRSVYSCGGAGFSGSDLGQGSSSRSSMSASVDSSSKEGMMIYRTVNGFPEDFSEKKGLTRVDSTANFPPLGASTSFDEPIIGLKLGKRTYFEDVCVVSDAKTSSLSTIPTASAATTKRSRVSYQSTQTPRCQVEGCNLDLKSAKDYHRRHRICESHSKSPKVIVAGMERRFCQQCSRFHELAEFDDKKRSCRRRLSDHNARRRRPQPEAIQFNSTRLSSSLYDRRQQMNLVFNKVPFPAASSTWQNACSFKVTQAGDSLIKTAKAGGIGTQINISTNEMPDSTSMLQIDSDKVLSFEGSTPRVFNQGLEAATYASNFDVAPDLRRALSLLSTNSWGLNEPEPASLNELMHANQSSMAQPVMHAELQNWALALSEHERVEAVPPGSRAHTLDLHNNGGIHFQEFQLVKGPFESGCFYSNQIN